MGDRIVVYVGSTVQNLRTIEQPAPVIRIVESGVIGPVSPWAPVAP